MKMSKELEALHRIANANNHFKYDTLELVDKDFQIVQQGLQRLESLEKGKITDIIENCMAFKNDNDNPSEVLECLERFFNSRKKYEPNNKYIFECITCLNSIKQALLKSQEQEKENELLKEIIKSFFDRGCPLHQYINSKGELMIEIDDDCSTMILGEYKGVDLDEKLKEVLKEVAINE